MEIFTEWMRRISNIFYIEEHFYRFIRLYKVGRHLLTNEGYLESNQIILIKEHLWYIIARARFSRKKYFQKNFTEKKKRLNIQGKSLTCAYMDSCGQRINISGLTFFHFPIEKLQAVENSKSPIVHSKSEMVLWRSIYFGI